MNARPAAAGIAAALLAALGASLVAAGDDAVPAKPAALPEGAGFASKLSGERLAKDARVLLAEDFEKGEIADLGKRWHEVKDPGANVLAWSDDRPAASPGKRSLSMTATLGRNEGGHLFAQLPRGVERAFARFYVKFAEDAGYEHHFVWLGGNYPPLKWPNPAAGTRPKGDDRVTVGIEPLGDYGRVAPPGVWNFYCYWHEMRISADQRYWGNCLRPAKDEPVPRGRWQCVEFMVQLNSTPDAADGDLALWLDGRLTFRVTKGVPRGDWSGMGFKVLDTGGTPFEGLRWRTSKDLLLNYFWLEHYVTERSLKQQAADPAKTPVNRVWFDDVVVATEYVGSLTE